MAFPRARAIPRKTKPETTIPAAAARHRPPPSSVSPARRPRRAAAAAVRRRRRRLLDPGHLGPGAPRPIYPTFEAAAALEGDVQALALQAIRRWPPRAFQLVLAVREVAARAVGQSPPRSMKKRHSFVLRRCGCHLREPSLPRVRVRRRLRDPSSSSAVGGRTYAWPKRHAVLWIAMHIFVRRWPFAFGGRFITPAIPARLLSSPPELVDQRLLPTSGAVVLLVEGLGALQRWQTRAAKSDATPAGSASHRRKPF